MSNPKSAGDNVRPGLKAGRVNEFTLIFKLKPGGAERMRKKIASDPNFQSHVDGVGTVHDLRFTTFDNDTRLFFASTFDGDWDAYIADFGEYIPDYIDLVFGEAEGYPGIRSPDFKDFLIKNQVTAMHFYSAYPNATVKDVWKALKIEKGLDVLLDAASG
jgi:hypothetical protein